MTPDDTVTDTTGAAHRYFSAADMDGLKKELEEARKETEAARDLAAKSAQVAEASRRTAEQSADARVDAFRSSYPTKLAFHGIYKPGVKPFFVGAIYHDDKCTLHPRESKRAADALRDQGRQAESDQLPDRERGLYRAQGSGPRLPRHRQTEARLRHDVAA